ncbi:MAG TPA: sigma-70 family RNA polymerase sigma factor, partial [Vicinamibacterales bacterium]
MTDDADRSTVRAAVEAVRRGDREAFAGIVKLYERRLYALSLMVTRDPAGAEEVAQDAFVRAFLHLDAYDERRPFYPWLSVIAVRLAQNWLVRRARVSSREGAEIETDTAAAATPDPLHELIEDEIDRALWRAVSALPSGERTAVILHYRQGLSVAEIASALGVTTGTVKTQLFRARRSLRTKLEPFPAVGSS